MSDTSDDRPERQQGEVEGTMVTGQPQWTPEMFATTKAHATQTFFRPELRRRIEAGEWDESVPVRAAQAVFYPGQETIVRFNDEVRAVLGGGHERREIDGKWTDVMVEVEWFELEPDEAHCGHMTFIATDEAEWGAFDARYNLPAVREHLAAAREFLDAAARDLAAEQLRVFVDALFSAVELTAKAFFVQTPDLRFIGRGSHKLVTREFNRERAAGNIDSEHAQLLNRLSALRPAGRYLDRAFSLDPEEAHEMIADAERLHARLVAESLPPRDQPDPVIRRVKIAPPDAATRAAGQSDENG